MLDAGRLSNRMNQLGVSQAELARRVGLSQQAVGKLVNGRSRETPKLEKIARELRTSSSFLEGEIDDPELGADLGQRLTSDEQEWVEIYEALTPEQRRNLRAIARDMARGNTPSTRIHDKRQGYGAPGQG